MTSHIDQNPCVSKNCTKSVYPNECVVPINGYALGNTKLVSSGSVMLYTPQARRHNEAHQVAFPCSDSAMQCGMANDLLSLQWWIDGKVHHLEVALRSHKGFVLGCPVERRRDLRLGEASELAVSAVVGFSEHILLIKTVKRLSFQQKASQLALSGHLYISSRASLSFVSVTTPSHPNQAERGRRVAGSEEYFPPTQRVKCLCR